MATLYVTEYSDMGVSLAGRTPLQIAQAPGLAQNNVVIGAGSLQSSAFNTSTRYIRVHTDAICSVAISSNPTATTASKRMAADQTEYWGVVAGHKIAVIANT